MEDEAESNGRAPREILDEMARRAQIPQRPFWRSPNVAWALMGALFLGVVVPCTLTWWHLGRGGLLFMLDDPSEPKPTDVGWLVEELVMLYLFAGMFCSPGALILGAFLFRTIEKHPYTLGGKSKAALIIGTLMGAAIAFMNLPGYMAIGFFKDKLDPAPWLRLAALFLVTGATCGAWIAWQAYREKNPAEPFFPRYSLRTLMLLVFAWGFLAALFMPL